LNLKQNINKTIITNIYKELYIEPFLYIQRAFFIANYRFFFFYFVIHLFSFIKNKIGIKIFISKIIILKIFIFQYLKFVTQKSIMLKKSIFLFLT